MVNRHYKFPVFVANTDNFYLINCVGVTESSSSKGASLFITYQGLFPQLFS